MARQVFSFLFERGIKYVIIFLSISITFPNLTSSTAEVSFLKQVPRLKDGNYWDIYYHCFTVGRTLQWRANNDVLDSFSGGSVPQVFFGMSPTFNYTATLLSSRPTNESEFTFFSVLVVSTEGGRSNINVSCSNGSALDTTNILDCCEHVEDQTNSTTVFLDHVLTLNVIASTISRSTFIYVCGVDNMFMTLNANGDDYSFTTFDKVGQTRHNLQEDDNAVKDLAILIGVAPYTLVTVLFVVSTGEVTVNCGYLNNYVQLISDYQTTTTENEIESDGHTLQTTVTDHTLSSSGITTNTEQMRTENVLPAILVPIFIVLLSLIIIFCICVWLIGRRYLKSATIKQKDTGSSTTQIRNNDVKYVVTVPKDLPSKESAESNHKDVVTESTDSPSTGSAERKNNDEDVVTDSTASSSKGFAERKSNDKDVVSDTTDSPSKGSAERKNNDKNVVTDTTASLSKGSAESNVKDVVTDSTDSPSKGSAERQINLDYHRNDIPGTDTAAATGRTESRSYRANLLSSNGTFHHWFTVNDKKYDYCSVYPQRGDGEFCYDYQAFSDFYK